MATPDSPVQGTDGAGPQHLQKTLRGRDVAHVAPLQERQKQPSLGLQFRRRKALEGLCISEATELQEPAQNELPAEPDVPFATFASTGLEANFEAIARLHMAALSANEVPTPKQTQQLVDLGGGSGRCGLPAASGSCGPACAWNLDVV